MRYESKGFFLCCCCRFCAWKTKKHVVIITYADDILHSRCKFVTKRKALWVFSHSSLHCVKGLIICLNDWLHCWNYKKKKNWNTNTKLKRSRVLDFRPVCLFDKLHSSCWLLAFAVLHAIWLVWFECDNQRKTLPLLLKHCLWPFCQMDVRDKSNG